MTISTAKGQINCYYAGDTKFGGQLEAILKSSDKDIYAIDITKTMPSDTMWHDMAKRLDTSLKTLINTEKIDDVNDASGYSEEDWVKILAKHPKAFKGAILMNDENISHILRYTEALEYFDVDSAGLEKTFHTEDPVISKQTDEDNFI